MLQHTFCEALVLSSLHFICTEEKIVCKTSFDVKYVKARKDCIFRLAISIFVTLYLNLVLQCSSSAITVIFMQLFSKCKVSYSNRCYSVLSSLTLHRNHITQMA